MRPSFLVAPACVLALVACGTDHPPAKAAKEHGPAAVQVAKAARGSVVRTIALPATVRANFEITLHAKANGYVTELKKDRGDTVAAGELIARLEIPELVTDLDGARATALTADATLKRLEAIRKADHDAVTDQDLDVERARDATAAAALKRIEALLAYAEVRAPFAGRVTERFVDPGALVQQGPIVSLIDDGPRRIIVDVPESESTAVADGAAAELSLEAQHGHLIHAKVVRTSGRLDPTARTLRVELQAAAAEPGLMPGMFGMASIELERHDHVLSVPPRAIQSEQNATVVYTVVGGKAKRVPVTVGLRTPTAAELTSGVAEGDSVIVAGAATALHDGAAVQATEAP